MPGIKSNLGDTTTSLIASSLLTGDAGHAPGNGGVSLAAQRIDADAQARNGERSVQKLAVEPRYVAAGSVRARAEFAGGGASARKWPANWLARLTAGKSRPPGKGSACVRAANPDTARAEAQPQAQAQAQPEAQTPQAQSQLQSRAQSQAHPLDRPIAMSLAQEAGIKKKVTATIYWNPHGQAQARRSGAPGTAGSSQARKTLAPSIASRPPAMPALSEKLATQVAAHMQGRTSTNAQAYLAALATQQQHRAESALSTLAGMLVDGSPPLSDSGVPPETRLARLATETWLLADCLRNDALPDSSGRPLFIARLNGHVDAVLDTLSPEALWAVYRRLTVDRALTVPPDTSTLAGRTGTFFNRVGMSAARTAWAASQVCALVDKPLSTQALGVVLRNAVATHRPDAVHDETALTGVTEELARLTTERAQYLLMRQLCLRAGNMLRDKGIPINELIGIATTVLPEAHYARNVAGTLRRTLVSFSPEGQPARYPADAEIRQRLASALGRFSDTELRAAADNLLSTHTPHMKRLVQAQAEHPAEQAALGRQFTILCEVLGQTLAQRLGDDSGLSAWKSLRGWDWDERLSRDTQVPGPKGLARLGHVAYRGLQRGLQRLFASVLPLAKTDQESIRQAYDEVVHAASGFIDAVDRNRLRDTRAEFDIARRDAEIARLSPQAAGRHGWTTDALRLFNESGARLMQAAHRYEALCASPGGRLARAELGLPGNPVQLLEAAFFEVMGGMPGARANVLGHTLFHPGWLKALRGLHEIKHLAYQAGPRPAQSVLGRLFNRDHKPWRPRLGMADAQTLLFGLQNAAGKEAAARASTEILRALARNRTDAAAGGSIAMHANGMPREDDVRMLDDIRTLEQRFRPLDRELVEMPAQPGVDPALDRFISMGMSRLSPGERAGIAASVFDLDRRPPAWLEQDEVWRSVARCCQRPTPRRDSETAVRPNSAAG